MACEDASPRPVHSPARMVGRFLYGVGSRRMPCSKTATAGVTAEMSREPSSWCAKRANQSSRRFSAIVLARQQWARRSATMAPAARTGPGAGSRPRSISPSSTICRSRPHRRAQARCGDRLPHRLDRAPDAHRQSALYFPEHALDRAPLPRTVGASQPLPDQVGRAARAARARGAAHLSFTFRHFRMLAPTFAPADLKARGIARANPGEDGQLRCRVCVECRPVLRQVEGNGDDDEHEQQEFCRRSEARRVLMGCQERPSKRLINCYPYATQSSSSGFFRTTNPLILLVSPAGIEPATY